MAVQPLAVQPLSPTIEAELALYQKQIKKYRAGELGETKMQKFRLQFGTYAQRQDGVQMQRIKIPGGYLNADQLTRLADTADRYASGFIHFTTREDAQLYYLQLEDAPALLRELAEVGITTREACGNTVRNITACYRAGVAHDEVFNVYPYAQALFKFLLRNKHNQNMGRKMKFAFEGCAADHSALAFHDLGFHAVIREENGQVQRGFRVHVGGGMGSGPHLAHIYSDFLPVEELFNFTTAVIRIFDRYGERKQRMKARLKFLVQSMGWEKFRAAVDAERAALDPLPPLTDFLEAATTPVLAETATSLNVLNPLTNDLQYQQWARDSVIAHRVENLRGVHVRTKFGDLTSDNARALADLARRYSAGELRVSIEQNLFLPWVRVTDLPGLYAALKTVALADAGAETIADVTACPGADTCRLGIASAKGLGTAISDSFFNGKLAPHFEAHRDLRIKISGCPNGCAQHAVANIGFHAAAVTQNGHNLPAHLLFLGGQANHGKPRAAKVFGRFPARNAINVVEALLTLHDTEKQPGEDFNAFLARIGDQRVKEALEPHKAIPAFEDDPQFYDDYGHENERFTVRSGVRGECAGTTIAEVVPTFDKAHTRLAQTAAYIQHGNYEQALLEAYEAAAAAARVPLYQKLVDPFTSLEALWEFENLFVLSGQTGGSWHALSASFESLKTDSPAELSANAALEQAQEFVSYCEKFAAG
ncbi:MAG: nitrite/sulfite reductase [Acidobacteria bacterium]|nr:nitrite/sulfite reductase [Acidobacteriota bacterium]MBI3422872.1 nitrite/sulfite reductase [Acidobacteriota bacterium]